MAEYNGENDKPIYVSVKTMVWDVSEARNVYGHGGLYANFAGTECGIALAKLSMDANEINKFSFDQLSEDETKQLDHWLYQFQYVRRYLFVGRLIPPSQFQPNRIFAREDLSKCNGDQTTQKQKIPEGYATYPIYIGIDGLVLDVSFGGLDFYGPGGPYHVFAGTDASVGLAKMSLTDTGDGATELTEKEKKTLQDWKNSFLNKKKYPIVGRLQHLS